jgi:hypothetical protein
MAYARENRLIQAVWLDPVSTSLQLEIIKSSIMFLVTMDYLAI